MVARTLLLSSAFQLLMLAGVAAPAWRASSTRGFTLRFLLAVGGVLGAMGLFAQRGALSGVFTVVVANALLIAAHQVWLDALYLLCAAPRAHRRVEAIVAALGIGAVAAIWATDASPDQLALAKPRVLLSTVPLIVSGVLWLRALYTSTAAPWPVGRRYLIWAAAVGVGLNVVRAASYALSPDTADPLQASASIGAVLLFNLTGLLTGVGLIMEVETRARDSLVRANSKLETDALTDPLTSLGNRRRLEQETDAIIVAARRRDWAVAVLVLDIDHFKHINDRWGHAAGDAVLRAVASVCAEHLREHDLLVRWGGEEFMVVLPRCDAAAATLVASRILDAVRSATMLPDGSDAVTASIGIAQLHATESSFTEAIRRADAAMYRAKAAGRDRYEVHAERSPAA